MREFRTNRMRNSQQFDLPDDSGRSGEFHIVVGHVDAQSTATHGDRPMVDACFGTQGDGGGAQPVPHDNVSPQPRSLTRMVALPSLSPSLCSSMRTNSTF